MTGRLMNHLRGNAIAYVALGGGAYAAAKINGKQIRKNSEPANRLKKNSVTGKQVNESTLGAVPNATRATSATTATSADVAKDANALGGTTKPGFGQGVVSGSVYGFSGVASIATYLVPPYGIFDKSATGDVSVEAIAPVNMTIRDFVGEFAVGAGAGESIAFGLQITPPAQGATTVPLCTVTNTQLTCRSDGPVLIPRDATYRLSLTVTGISGNEVVGFQYRDAAG